MKKEMEKVYYCEKCGVKMFYKIESAVNWSPWWSFLYTFPKYNKENGQKNLVKVYYCPNGIYKTFFGTKEYDKEHSKFGIKYNF